jgi:hypothetical protein
LFTYITSEQKYGGVNILFTTLLTTLVTTLFTTLFTIQ